MVSYELQEILTISPLPYHILIICILTAVTVLYKNNKWFLIGYSLMLPVTTVVICSQELQFNQDCILLQLF